MSAGCVGCDEGGSDTWGEGCGVWWRGFVFLFSEEKRAAPGRLRRHGDGNELCRNRLETVDTCWVRYVDSNSERLIRLGRMRWAKRQGIGRRPRERGSGKDIPVCLLFPPVISGLAWLEDHSEWW